MANASAMKQLPILLDHVDNAGVLRTNLSKYVSDTTSSDTDVLPGKLGDEKMTLMTEPRYNQALLAHLKKELIFGKWGVVGKPLPMPFGENSPRFFQHKWNEFVEKVIVPQLFKEENFPRPDTSEIDQFTEVIKGTDGNDITLYIAKPKQAAGHTPCLLHIHGGGMTILSATDVGFRMYRTQLAIRGFTVVGVEFRNASGLLGRHPYPAGLTDCMSALAWVKTNRERLGISRIVLHGESGGGNLCTAMALQAKRDDRLSDFDGVFAMCPFIAGPEVWKSKSFPSLRECDGYFVAMAEFRMCAKLYDPDSEHLHDPRAWPLNAQPVDLQGLPPHVIQVAELDPLRDEGVAYFEKLKQAGVRTDLRFVKGVHHIGDMNAFCVPGAEHLFEELVDSLRLFFASL